MSNDQNQLLASISKGEPTALDLSTAVPIEDPEPPAIDLSTAVPIEVPAEVRESEVVYWSSWAIPKAIVDDLLGPGKPDPMSDLTGTVAPKWKKAIAEYWEKRSSAGKIPPSTNVAPPLPKPFDPAMSVPPTIGDGQSIPLLRAGCRLCIQCNKGVPTVPHDCRQYQGV